MRISVIMAAYNGARFIEEQLYSICHQSRTPDEVIILDDHSTDETVNIIKRFINDNDLAASWKLFINDHNIGWRKNFFQGIEMATGDIIFFSDQDDIWMPNKIEIMTGAMEREDVGCVYGGYEFIDDNGVAIPGAEGRKNVATVNEIVKFNTIVTMGCRMCINREIADAYLKVNAPEYSYDTQIGRLAYLYSRMSIIQNVVIKYRIHSSNTSGISSVAEEGSLSLEERIREIEENIKWLDKLREYDVEYKKGTNKELFDNVVAFQNQRVRYLKGEGRQLIFSLNPYFYRDKTMMVGDFVYRHRLNRIMKGLRSKCNG